MNKPIESDLLIAFVSAFKITEIGDKKLAYWSRKDGRTKRGYLQHMIHNLPEIPTENQEIKKK